MWHSYSVLFCTYLGKINLASSQVRKWSFLEFLNHNWVIGGWYNYHTIAWLMLFVYIRFMRSSIFDKESTGIKGAYVVVGTVSGMLCGICFMILLKALQSFMLGLIRRWEARKHQVRAFAIWFRRACLVVAYFCGAGWLMLQYSKMIGLKQLVLGSKFADGRTM